jgi:hypothetical protein
MHRQIKSQQRESIRKQIKAPIPVFFGFDELEAIKRLQQRAEPFLYVDHAYFDRGYERGNFRAALSTIHQTHVYDLPDDRRKKFGVKLAPWREGNRIVFIPGPKNPLAFHDDSGWNDKAIDRLVELTDREIYVKDQKTKGLGDSIHKCWALVSHSSVAAVEAAMAGVPVICPPTSPAWPVGAPLERIESPVRPDRDAWVNTLTYSQFSLDELRSGFAWETIKELNGL